MRSVRIGFLGRSLMLTSCVMALSGAAWAADSEASERVGVLSGVLVGALVGGPPGAVIGAIGGGLAGRSAAQSEQITRQDMQVQRLRAELQRAEQQRQSAQRHAAAANRVASAAPSPVRSLPHLALESSVQFRTGSAELEPHYASQVRGLAHLVSGLERVRVRLCGYADTRGPEAVNQRLSAARVQTIRALLIAGGVDPQHIRAHAFGESRPLYGEGDREGRDFERRVLIRIDSGETRS